MYQLHSSAGTSHQVLASLARRLARPPLLDVGAAEGYLGQVLAGSGLAIDAIEPNPLFAAAAQPYYREVYVSQVETAPLREAYGTIICGDVLEHLVDPPAALRMLARHLRRDGYMLVSLPNVAHIAVRLLLLSGRFPHMERGPLDRTHLHFFTRATAEALLREAGLAVVERHPTIVPLADIANRRWCRLVALVEPIQRPLVRFLPSLFAYQWVFVATYHQSD